MKLSLFKIILMVAAALAVLAAGTGAALAATASSSITVSLPINNYISISQPTDVSMPAIAGTGGSSEGSASWSVITNNALGYSLAVAAGSSPAMNSGSNSIPDYTTSVPDTPETWSVAADQGAFGFSAEGPATSADTWGTPSTGNGKYRGFNGTTGIAVANNPLFTTGQTTSVYFKGEIGTSYTQPSGTYSSSITATATTL